jgi:hypothetical protein
LDFDRTTLDPRDMSYAGQLAELEREGWELEDHEESSLRYLRRHRRIGEIHDLFGERGQRLRLSREDDGTWTAVVLPSLTAGSTTGPPDFSGATPLEAADAAWAHHGSEPASGAAT